MASIHSLQVTTGDSYQENCYILWLAGTFDAVVFDPGESVPEIRAALKENNLQIAAFLQTHCHFDHIAGLGALKMSFPAAPLYVPEIEAEWLSRPTLNLSYFCGGAITAPPADKLVKENDEISVAGMRFRAIHVPGHSPGSMVYFVQPSEGPPHAVAGDTLMRGSIGRGDLPGGEGEDVLVSNIQQRLFTLPGLTLVHPGHGLETTIDREKLTNPFCGDRR